MENWNKHKKKPLLGWDPRFASSCLPLHHPPVHLSQIWKQNNKEEETAELVYQNILNAVT